jgi:4-hydroxy-2-oxoheptanedioate aldolase
LIFLELFIICNTIIAIMKSRLLQTQDSNNNSPAGALSFRDKLEAGIPQIGLFTQYDSASILERIGPNWDWIWLDGQHGQIGYQEMINLVRVCELIQRPAFVRVAYQERGAISLAADMAPSGIVVPQVETVEEAKAIVKGAKFPPIGQRSYGGRRPIDFHGRLYSNTANQDVILIAQIESPDAIRDAHKIAAVPGIDALIIGSDDVTLRQGHPMDKPKDQKAFAADLAKVKKACDDNGKFMMGIGTGVETMQTFASLNITWVIAASVTGILATESKKTSDEAKAIFQNHSPAEATNGKHAAKTLY